NTDADDHVAILLDTYLDHRRAIMFAVNPLGVQEDGVWSDGVAAGAAGGPSAGGRFDATIDLNPDYVYESRGRVTDRGYEVEVRIPFKSLRYRPPGLLARRGRRRPGDPQPAVPPVLPGEAAVLPGGPRAVRHAQQSHLHAAHRAAGVRREARRQGRRHRDRVPRRRRQQRSVGHRRAPRLQPAAPAP